MNTRPKPSIAVASRNPVPARNGGSVPTGIGYSHATSPGDFNQKSIGASDFDQEGALGLVEQISQNLSSLTDTVTAIAGQVKSMADRHFGLRPETANEMPDPPTSPGAVYQLQAQVRYLERKTGDLANEVMRFREL